MKQKYIQTAYKNSISLFGEILLHVIKKQPFTKHKLRVWLDYTCIGPENKQSKNIY